MSYALIVVALLNGIFVYAPVPLQQCLHAGEIAMSTGRVLSSICQGKHDFYILVPELGNKWQHFTVHPSI